MTDIEKLEDIKDKIDIVNVFRPSAETPKIAEQAVKIGTKTLWLQYGIENEEAEKIAKEEMSIRKLLVISAIGTREYYRRLGYELEGPYMGKKL